MATTQPNQLTKPNAPAGDIVVRRMQFFRTGTHTDAGGGKHTYSEADLAELAAYDRKAHFAPLTIGHPQDDKPAYGGINAVIKDGDKLYADVMMSRAIAKGIDSYQYLGVSAALYDRNNPHNPTPGKLSVRHLALCGAVPPAIKGMAGLQEFAEGDSAEKGCLLYDEIAGWMIASPFEAIAGLLRGLREKMIAEKGVDEADLTIPNWKIDQIEESARQLRAAQEETPETNPTNQIYQEDQMTPEQIAAMIAENAALTARNATLAAANSANEAAQAAAKAKATHDANQAFCEGLVKDKQMLPKDVPQHVSTLDLLAQQDPAKDAAWTSQQANYAEGAAKPDRLTAYKDMLKTAPKISDILFAEQARKGQASTGGNAVNPLVADAESRNKR